MGGARRGVLGGGGRGRHEGERRQRGGGRGGRRHWGGLLGRGSEVVLPESRAIRPPRHQAPPPHFPYTCDPWCWPHPNCGSWLHREGSAASVAFHAAMITVADAELLEREEELDDAARAARRRARRARRGRADRGPAGPGQDRRCCARSRAEASGLRVLSRGRRRARARLRLRPRPPALRARAARRRSRALRAAARRPARCVAVLDGRTTRARHRRLPRRLHALVWLAANLAASSRWRSSSTTPTGPTPAA